MGSRGIATQWLISRLASHSNSAPGPLLPSAQASSVETKASPSAVQTIASVSAGRTVHVTVTQDAASTATTSDTAVSADSSLNRSKSPAGTIAGAVVGGVVLLGLALYVLFFLRSKKRAQEREQATLPPPYVNTDMSEELSGGKSHRNPEYSVFVTKRCTGTSASFSSADGIITNFESDEKARLRNITARDCDCDPDPHPDPVPQLDSTMIRPRVEMLGSIPGLRATNKSPNSSDNSDTGPNKNRYESDENNHVMSWAQFNSLGNRHPESRLWQPHSGPEVSLTVWENMGPASPTNPRNKKAT